MRKIEKCLISEFTTPDGVRRKYILPYQGNLSDGKYLALAERLLRHIGHQYAPNTVSAYAAANLLRNQALTGREKNVEVGLDDVGFMRVLGESWGCFGLNVGDVVVLDELPNLVACAA